MPKPDHDLPPFGDPESIFCRWCGEGRMRLRQAMFCATCDGRPDAQVTWQAGAA